MTNEPEDPFDAADFYDCGDIEAEFLRHESLRHESPEEAIEELVDCFCTPGCDVEAIVRDHGDLVVYAYRRKAIPDNELKNWATRLGEYLGEVVEEEYGDPDGYNELNIEEFTQKLLPLVRECVEKYEVWACEEVASRTYTPEKVLEILRESCSEWFEKDE